MVFGVTLHTYTVVHVVLSLIGIGAGSVVLWGLIAGKWLDGLTTVFLVTTVLTSATGFGFPVEHLLPSHIVGSISLVVLAIAILARYPMHLAGGWRRIFVITASIALYLNVFVLVVQLFEKVTALKALAPTQKEAPFLVAQLVVLALFILLTIRATKGFREGQARPA